MNNLQSLERKILELDQEELIILLEKITQALRLYNKKQKSNREKVLSVLSEFKGKDYFNKIHDPVQWQKDLRTELGN